MDPKKLSLIFACLLSWAAAATSHEKVRNDKVVASEMILAPGEGEVSAGLPCVTVFLSDGTIERPAANGKPEAVAVKRGQMIFRGWQAGAYRVTGPMEVRFVRVDFLGKETAERWGATGLAPNYRMLVENGFVRAYNIAIPAGFVEPQHTHHDRVVVCLSGADLRHVLPDGHEEDSTLHTDDCLWRRGQTHVGKNIGKTDLWVIAIEPK